MTIPETTPIPNVTENILIQNIDDRKYTLPVVVVRRDLRAQSHLFERDVDLVAAALPQLALLLVAPLSVVHDAAHRWIGGRRHFDDVEATLVRVGTRVVRGHDAELAAVLGDEPHGSGAELFVDPGRDPTHLRGTARLARSAH